MYKSEISINSDNQADVLMMWREQVVSVAPDITYTVGLAGYFDFVMSLLRLLAANLLGFVNQQH